MFAREHVDPKRVGLHEGKVDSVKAIHRPMQRRLFVIADHYIAAQPRPFRGKRRVRRRQCSPRWHAQTMGLVILSRGPPMRSSIFASSPTGHNVAALWAAVLNHNNQLADRSIGMALRPERAMTRSERRHLAMLRRLDELIAGSSRPMSLADICRALKTSERTLRACCRKYLRTSPMRYHWLCRMHLARHALVLATPATTTVTEIATEYGFSELGRFAVSYRALFGESPSSSLRRPPERGAK
jgi:AraC-like DNA-binding protein